MFLLNFGGIQNTCSSFRYGLIAELVFAMRRNITAREWEPFPQRQFVSCRINMIWRCTHDSERCCVRTERLARLCGMLVDSSNSLVQS